MPLLHIHVGDRTATILPLGKTRDDAPFKEEAHPRNKGGQFAKKGEVSNSIAVPLKAHGFKQHPGSLSAIYQHPSGHTIAVKPVPAGLKYSSGYEHYGPGATVGKASEATHGSGGVALTKHLANLGMQAAPAAPKSTPTSPAKIKPPPSFEHPAPVYQDIINKYGLTPVKKTPTTQTYTTPTGAQLVIKTKPNWYGSYPFKLMKAGSNYPIKSKQASSLEYYLKSYAAQAGLQPPAAAPSQSQSTEHVVAPATAKYENQQPVASWNGGTAIRYYNGSDTNLKESLVIGTGETNKGKWQLWSAKKAQASMALGGSANGIVATGTGQESLNAAFEKLHPRDAGGKFIEVPKSFDPVNNDSDTTKFAEAVKAAGYKETGPMEWTLPGKLNNTIIKADSTGTWTEFDKGSVAKQGFNWSTLYNNVILPKIQSAAPAALATPAPSTPPASSKPQVDLGTLKQIGPQLGSNPGGQYEDDNGQKYYVKKTQSPSHARNENLAAALYAAAGAGTLQYRKSNDPNAVVTEMVPLEAKIVSELTPAQRTLAQQQFAVHAWLANWDAVGLNGDNIGAVNGKPVNLDLGGSIAYRAKGAPKVFGPSATEWDSLRSGQNAQAASLFGKMTPIQLKESATILGLKINDKVQVAKIVEEAGYEGQAAANLTDTLWARRNDIIAKGAKAIAPPPPPPPPPPEFKAPFDFKAPDSGPSIYELNKFSKDLGTSAQRAAARTYTGGTYQQINRALRYGYHSGEHPQANNIKNITDWLDQASMPEDTVCTRRVSNDYAEFLLENTKKGSSFTDMGFGSTSRTGQWSGHVTCMVKIPKGSKAASLQAFSRIVPKTKS
jgi:hypothetical protein